MLLRNHHRGDQRHQAKPQRSSRDATQSLYRPVPWEKGALNAPCHPSVRHQPCSRRPAGSWPAAALLGGSPACALPARPCGRRKPPGSSWDRHSPELMQQNRSMVWSGSGHWRVTGAGCFQESFSPCCRDLNRSVQWLEGGTFPLLARDHLGQQPAPSPGESQRSS